MSVILFSAVPSHPASVPPNPLSPAASQYPSTPHLSPHGEKARKFPSHPPDRHPLRAGTCPMRPQASAPLTPQTVPPPMRATFFSRQNLSAPQTLCLAVWDSLDLASPSRFHAAYPHIQLRPPTLSMPTLSMSLGLWCAPLLLRSTSPFSSLHIAPAVSLPAACSGIG